MASVLTGRVPAAVAADLDDLKLLEGIQIIDTPMIHRRAAELAIPCHTTWSTRCTTRPRAKAKRS
ncbi:hypothetical protein [Accumulibacter sp.]|uniref:hypothetical protein n=1 Tax=Accumulibacter sp. TaxID=2053492 RepID=UPI00257C1CE4|nr:hypothetical protein [Accumulibacter sp.]